MSELAPDRMLGSGIRLLRPLDLGIRGGDWWGEQVGTGRRVRVRHGAGDRLGREARARAAEPNDVLPTVIDAGMEPDGVAWIAEERARGTPVAEWLSRHGPMPSAVVGTLLADLLGTLAYARRLGFELPDPDVACTLVDHAPGAPPRVRLERPGERATGSQTFLVGGEAEAKPSPGTRVSVRGLLVSMLVGRSDAVRRARDSEEAVAGAPTAMHGELRAFLAALAAPSEPTIQELEALSHQARALCALVGVPAPVRGERTRVGGRYELLNQLGAGGMGRVHRALDGLTGRVVSLKLCARNNGGGLEEEALAREFRLLAALRHPNLVEVLDYGVDPELGAFVVTELYENALELRLAAAGAGLRGQLGLIAQLLDAVDYLHQQGVIHRDLKPGNVVVVHEWVRVLDFGISAEVEELAYGARLAGTMGYLAPELLTGARPSVASDLWAVGVIAGEVLTGRHPLPNGGGAGGGLGLAQERRAEPFAGDELPPQIAAILLPLLAMDPADRPARAGDVAARLRATVDLGGREEARPSEWSARFVGRRTERARLTELLEAAQANRGAIAVLEGPIGMGKSRLLDELRSRAVLSGVAVVATHGIPERRRPHQLWAPLARWLGLYAVPDPLEASVLAAIDPELAVTLDHHLAAPPLPASGAADRIRATLVSLTARALRPLLLVVDDAHWLSEDEWTVLSAIASLVPPVGEAGGLPILLVIAGREASADHRGLGPGAHRLRLGPLDAGEARLLANQLLPNAAEHLILASEGIPLILVETLREASSEESKPGGTGGSLKPGDRVTTAGGGILARRVARLPERARQVLCLAAVTGRAVDRDLLRGLHAPEIVSEALDDAHAIGILEWHEGALRFAHEGFRDALLAPLGDAERRALEGAVASAMAQQPDAAPAAIAWHFQRAGDAPEAARWAGVAGRAALDRGSLRDGVALMLAASEPTTPAERAERAFQLGEALYALGEMDVGVLHLRAAMAACADPCPSTRGGWAWFVGVELVRQLWHRTVRPKAARPGARTSLDAQVLLGTDAYMRDRPMEGLALGLSALNRAESVGAWGATARQWGGLQLVLGSIGFHALAARLGTFAAEAGSRAGADPDRARALAAAGFYYVGVGRWTEATAMGEAALATFQEVGLLRAADEAQLLLAWSASARGELDDADARYELVSLGAARRGDEQMRAWGVYGRALVALDAGRNEDAALHIDGVPLATAPDPMVIPAIRAKLAVAAGRAREAWDLACLADRALTDQVYARGVHVATLTLLVDVLTSLEAAADPALAPERSLLEARATARLKHLGKHVAVAPIVEPAWRFHTARRLRARGQTAQADAEIAKGAAASGRLGMVGAG